jgi:hypothetical protein
LKTDHDGFPPIACPGDIGNGTVHVHVQAPKRDTGHRRSGILRSKKKHGISSTKNEEFTKTTEDLTNKKHRGFHLGSKNMWVVCTTNSYTGYTDLDSLKMPSHDIMGEVSGCHSEISWVTRP